MAGPGGRAVGPAVTRARRGRWRTPFDDHDLARGAAEVPGFTPGSTGLAVVSLSGTTSSLGRDDGNIAWGPDDVLSAWRPAAAR
ncbi:MAG TPA: hypothetical protein VLJ59_21100 [Mycobacteriales bacterium]|nr:hypothetical protein [Mycobacteriales bacterium]